ncbi:MAG: cell division protein FtsZ [Phycisphaerae bacterium]|nr:cell division protein FtsZ [Phycisphaerae bacterium]
MIKLKENYMPGAKIKVIGVGGGGGNAVRTMILSQLAGVDFIAANTDSQALAANPAPTKVQLGESVTRGLGAGADPELGREAALETQEQVADICAGSDMVFVTAGMGGGTGTGGAPIIANIARSQGTLTVGVVTKPFSFEGARRSEQALQGIEELKSAVDSLLIIPNDKLLEIVDEDIELNDAFRLVDQVLLDAVGGIVDVIQSVGSINLDFADVRRIMQNSGMALMGIGKSSGENRAQEALEQAINCPLLEDVSLTGAQSILLFVTGKTMSLKEFNYVGSKIKEAAHPDANIIVGQGYNDSLENLLKITLIATRFNKAASYSKVSIASENEVVQAASSSASQPRDHYSQPHTVNISQPSRVYRKYSDPTQEAFSFPGINNTTHGMRAADEYDLPAYIRNQRNKRK